MISSLKPFYLISRNHLLQKLAGASCIVFLFLAPAAHAIIDVNANGISDIFEKNYNAGQLFSTQDPRHLPSADPDGDSWSNLLESITGTDPFDSTAGTGFVALTITQDPVRNITWPTIAGKKYILESSPSLSPTSWQPIGTFIGDGATATKLPPTQASSLPSNYFRLRIEDRDLDSDQLTDADEIVSEAVSTS
jgi:hypothetical protein